MKPLLPILVAVPVILIASLLAGPATAESQITEEDLINFFEAVINQLVHAPLPAGISELVTLAENSDTVAVASLQIHAGNRRKQILIQMCGANQLTAARLARQLKAIDEVISKLSRIKAQRRRDAKKAEEEGWDPAFIRLGAGQSFTGAGSYTFNLLDDGFFDLPGDDVPGSIAAVMTPAANDFREFIVPITSASVGIDFVPTIDPGVFDLMMTSFQIGLDPYEMFPGSSTGINLVTPFVSGSAPVGTYDASTCLLEGRFEGMITNDLTSGAGAPMVFFADLVGTLEDSSGTIMASTMDPMIIPLPPHLVPPEAPKLMGAHVFEFDAELGRLQLLENTSLLPGADVAMVRYRDGTYGWEFETDLAVGAVLNVTPLDYLGTGPGGVHLFSDAAITLENSGIVLMTGVLVEPMLFPEAGHFRARFEVTSDGGVSRAVTEIATAVQGFREFQLASGPGAYDLVEVTQGFTVSAAMPWPELFHLGVENPMAANLADSGPNDAFPAAGLDLVNLGDNSVRFDMARHVGAPGYPFNDPGDSICADIFPQDPLADLAAVPLMHYLLHPNAMFDPYRTSGMPLQGFVAGDTVRSPSGAVVPYRWSFDLPDTGFLFPGDIIHYSFAATEDPGGGPLVSFTLPADTTGFSRFPPLGLTPIPEYHEAYSMNALPSLKETKAITQPPILIWNDSGDEELFNYWRFALDNLGYLQTVDYDVFTTRAPGNGVGNGLGGRAAPPDIAGYETILYTSGRQAARTITEVDFAGGDPGNDIGLLSTWYETGNRNLLLCGDNLVDDLGNAGAASITFLATVCPVSVTTVYGGSLITPLIGNQANPRIRAVGGPAVFAGGTEWFLDPECDHCGGTDAIIPASGSVMLAEFLAPDGSTGAYPYAAAVAYEDLIRGNRTVLLPYDLGRIGTDAGGDKSPAPLPARARVLADVLAWFGSTGGSGAATGVPGNPFRLAMRVHPNPFNPATTVSFELAEAGPVTLAIYGIDGRRVATLIDGWREAGLQEVVWRGLDHRGATVASGLYLARLEAAGQEQQRKLMLVR